MTEFNLSNTRVNIWECADDSPDWQSGIKGYREEDVREAVRLLKRQLLADFTLMFVSNEMNPNTIMKHIDKIFGSKLTEQLANETPDLKQKSSGRSSEEIGLRSDKNKSPQGLALSDVGSSVQLGDRGLNNDVCKNCGKTKDKHDNRYSYIIKRDVSFCAELGLGLKEFEPQENNKIDRLKSYLKEIKDYKFEPKEVKA